MELSEHRHLRKDHRCDYMNRLPDISVLIDPDMLSFRDPLLSDPFFGNLYSPVILKNQYRVGPVRRTLLTTVIRLKDIPYSV